MAIFLRQSHLVKPARWGSYADVMYAIRKNSEKIYGVDPDSNVLCMPLFWGFPCLDFSGKQNHGTPVGGVAYHGESLDFDGVDDYVGVGDLSAFSSDSYSVLLWLKADSLSHTEYPGIISNNVWVGFNIHTTTIGILYAGTGGLNRIQTSEGYITTAKGFHLVLTLEHGIGHKLYKNSVKTHENANFPASVWGITEISGTTRWSGLISEIRVNDVAHTAEQIALFYDLPYGLYQQVNRPFWSIPAGKEVLTTVDIDALLQKSYGATFNIDSLLQTRVLKSVLFDALLEIPTLYPRYSFVGKVRSITPSQRILNIIGKNRNRYLS